MASTINLDNIHLGLGQLEIGAYVNGSFVSYRNVGAIRGTLSVAITRTILQFKTGRPLNVVKQEVTEESFQMTFRLAELTIANLKDLLGTGITSSGAPVFMTGTNMAPMGDQTDSYMPVVYANTLGLGGSCDLNNAAVRFTHPKQCVEGADKRQIVEFFRAQFGGSVTLPYSESDWFESEFQFTALADFSRPAGRQVMQLSDEV